LRVYAGDAEGDRGNEDLSFPEGDSLAYEMETSIFSLSLARSYAASASRVS